LPYRVTLLAVFVLTVTVDLTVAVEFGLAAACLTFIYRISSLSRIEEVQAASWPDLNRSGLSGSIRVYRLYGALFFGAAQMVESLAQGLSTNDTLVLDLKNLIYMDTTGADALMALARQCQKKGGHLRLMGLSHQPMDIAHRTGLSKLALKPSVPAIEPVLHKPAP
jgi:SulP family sulfate permease